MSASAKVGSWLGKSKSGKSPATREAYESDSDAESVITASDSGEASPKRPAAAATGASTPAAGDDVDSDDEVVQDESAREANIDWATVIPKVRPALLDRSQKRREQFVARYLYVTDECGST